MKKRKDFYWYVLSLVFEKGPIRRKVIHHECREHFHISESEWCAKKNGNVKKELEFAIQGLRDTGLIDLNDSLFRITTTGREAVMWDELELGKYVGKKMCELRKSGVADSSRRKSQKGKPGNKVCLGSEYGKGQEMDPVANGVGFGKRGSSPMNSNGGRKMRMSKIVKSGAIAMICAAVIGLLSSNERNALYCLLLLIAILLLLWQKRKTTTSGADSEARPLKPCPTPSTDTPEAAPPKPTPWSGAAHAPIDPPKKPMQDEAKPRALKPDEPMPNCPDPVDEKVSYFERYLDVVNGRHGEAAKERLRGDVEDLFGNSHGNAESKEGRIIELLEECKNKGCSQKVNGLVVGRVQSGKTQNYIGLMLKAIDKGCNLILILTSNNVALGTQTRSRVVSEFEGVGLKREKYNLISNFLEEARALILPSVDSARMTVCFALKETHHLGSSNNSQGVHGWLKENKDTLESAKVLIVDDEADSYTQNTRANLTKYWDYSDLMRCADDIDSESEGEDPPIAKAWKCVAEWVRKVARDGFVTKDPLFEELREKVSEWGTRSRERLVAILLRDGSNFLHVLRLDEKRDLAQLYGHVKNYFTRPKWMRSICGDAADYYDAFFYILKYGCDIQPERSTINKAICGIVKDYTYGNLVYVGYTATPYANVLNERFGDDNPLEPAFVQSLTISPNYLGLERLFGSCWEAAEGNEASLPFVVARENDSMDQPLAWTFCCAAMRAAIREKLEDERRDSRGWRWTTMMVNLSPRVDEHARQDEKIRKLVNDKLKDREGFKSECLAVFDLLKSKGISAEDFKKTFPDYDGEVSDLERSVVERKIATLIDCRHVDVLVLNGIAENDDNYDWYVQDGDYIKKNPQKRIPDDHIWIVVGGNKLSRGLTFDGLVTSVFDRESPSVCVDTLTQMGRWFGYRTNYELMPRIWMPKVTASEFRKIADLERDWHSRVKDMFDKREPVSNLRFMDIGREMSGRSAAQMRDDGENPLVVNEYRVGENTLKKGMDDLNDFLTKLGKEMDRPSEDYGEWYDKWHCWRAISRAIVQDYVRGARERMSPRIAKRVMRFIDESLKPEGVFDVVLENPDSNGRTISSAQGLKEGYEVHVMGASDIHFIGRDLVAAEKFHGQYDALKAVVPKAVLDSIKEKHPRSRLNDSEAFKEIFQEVKARGISVNPILRIGFINAPGEFANGRPIVTFSIYWPLHDRARYIEPSTGTTLPGAPVSVCLPAGRTNRKKAAVAVQTEERSSGAIHAQGSLTTGKPSKNPPAEGLTEEKKDGLLRALKELADKPCPWYSLMKFNNRKEGNFWGLEEITSLGFSPEEEDAVIRFVTENGWRKEESEDYDKNGWYVLAPTSFAEQGGIVAAVREKYIECAKEALKESLGRKEKGAKLDGKQLRENTDSLWNKKGYPSVNEKIDAILLKNWTIPYYVGTSKQQERYEKAISELRERGFVVEKKSNKCYYSLMEESDVAQKADVQGSSRDSAPTSRGGGDDMETLLGSPRKQNGNSR